MNRVAYDQYVELMVFNEMVKTARYYASLSVYPIFMLTIIQLLYNYYATRTNQYQKTGICFLERARQVP